MRQIKFRGKRKDYGCWLYGDYCSLPNSTILFISEKQSVDFERVITETVGQFTGSYDKNGKEIYEGDIIKYQSFANWDSITGYDDSRNIGTVYYNENKASFFVKMEIEVYVSSFHYIGKNEPLSKTSTTWGLEIIGNIHDNSELLNPQ